MRILRESRESIRKCVMGICLYFTFVGGMLSLEISFLCLGNPSLCESQKVEALANQMFLSRALKMGWQQRHREQFRIHPTSDGKNNIQLFGISYSDPFHQSFEPTNILSTNYLSYQLTQRKFPLFATKNTDQNKGYKN